MLCNLYYLKLSRTSCKNPALKNVFQNILSYGADLKKKLWTVDTLSKYCDHMSLPCFLVCFLINIWTDLGTASPCIPASTAQLWNTLQAWIQSCLFRSPLSSSSSCVWEMPASVFHGLKEEAVSMLDQKLIPNNKHRKEVEMFFKDVNWTVNWTE